MSDAPLVLVTRSAPGAFQTVEALEEQGLRAIASPVFELKAREPWPRLDLDLAGGIVFTSPNAVQFVAEAEAERDLPVWAVGRVTGNAARAAGFRKVETGPSDAGALVELIIANAEKDAAPLYHLANSKAGRGLTDALRRENVACVFKAVYDPVDAKAFSDEARAALESGEISAVMIHSRHALRVFLRLADGLDLSRIALVAMSEQARGNADSAGFRTVRVARRPNEAALIEAVVETVAQVD